MNYASISPSTDKVHPVGTDFTNISLETESVDKKKKKVPIRVIHCSDGILEEYSSDEEDHPPPPPPVDTKMMTWGPWSFYMMKTAAVKTLGAADFCGEKLAWFFGITSPKYQSAIDEFYRMKRQEEEDERSEQRHQDKMEGLSAVKVTDGSVKVQNGADHGATAGAGDQLQKF